MGGPGDSFRITLGSCVGLCLIWSRQARFGVAHVLLPSWRDGSLHLQRSRFADSAVPFLMEQLGAQGRHREVSAFIAGGGRMYDSQGEKEPVGQSNRETLKATLQEHRIRIEFEDLGGESPRQLVVDGPSRQIYSVHLDDAASSKNWAMPRRFLTSQNP